MSSRKSLVVVNLRAQPVEIQHGGEVVVVPALAHAELAAPAVPEGQLAELARQGAVAVHTAPAAPAPARARAAKKKPKPKPPAAKKPAEKKPQGGA